MWREATVERWMASIAKAKRLENFELCSELTLCPGFILSIASTENPIVLSSLVVWVFRGVRYGSCSAAYGRWLRHVFLNTTAWCQPTTPEDESTASRSPLEQLLDFYDQQPPSNAHTSPSSALSSAPTDRCNMETPRLRELFEALSPLSTFPFALKPRHFPSPENRTMGTLQRPAAHHPMTLVLFMSSCAHLGPTA